ncbi:MAG TPA: hypothetical protein VEA80_03985 [Vitreimonas sp.]|nr:hypothetical protein [Vitreimonas sp.]HYD86610.1 hypothetical protein [Vitreimonas sp.]
MNIEDLRADEFNTIADVIMIAILLLGVPLGLRNFASIAGHV